MIGTRTHKSGQHDAHLRSAHLYACEWHVSWARGSAVHLQGAPHSRITESRR